MAIPNSPNFHEEKQTKILVVVGKDATVKMAYFQDVHASAFDLGRVVFGDNNCDQ